MEDHSLLVFQDNMWKNYLIGSLISFLISFLSQGVFSAHAYKELLLENRGGHPIRVVKVILDGEHYVVSSVAPDG